ncbi:neutral alpha-glucosidase C-like isoform X2 [Cylas formicarius]|uniref:neutral alpha-glucosidase C-like isoform X2 n=1 Tax=Cylas formicarius TaxID=197179 RepID=UPI002958C2AC|nr:neutral alpha-glucosidase C-like isoform X2 [Cylas formicarius]
MHRMLRQLAFIAACWAVALGFKENNKDLPYPKNCSTVDYCSNLRSKIPSQSEIYAAQFVGIANKGVKFSLKNGENELMLEIYSLNKNRFRFIIEEPDSHRYKLEHSLVREPTVRGFDEVEGFDDHTIATDTDGNSVRVNYSPFEIKFYSGKTLVTKFDGERLIMDNTKQSQAFAFYATFPQASKFVGLHEHGDILALRHTSDQSTDPYRLKNTDFGDEEYHVNTTEAMYGSVPLLYALGKEFTPALFLHNAAEMYVDIDNHKLATYFMVEGGTMDVFVLLGPKIRDSLQQYMDLTGTSQLPQLWALGYHQCRIQYGSTEDVKETIGGFDSANFPMDTLWLVRSATYDQKWFTWDFEDFADPVALLEWVDSQAHRKLTVMAECSIKIDPTYSLYTEAVENGLFVKDIDGVSDFINLCWAENSSWVDFLNPAARDFYAKQHHYDNFPSTPALGGFWNDMDEPTLFDNLYERTLPSMSLHYGNVPHRDIHNAYSLLHSIATYQGLLERDNGRYRPFILTRAVFAGSQRYAAKWSGDNWGLYLHLRYSVPMTLTANLAGIVFYGADIPGFYWGDDYDDQLVIRWYQIAVWIPFFRAHADSGDRREPYTFGKETQDILRETFSWRYSHLPYWYTIFYEHTLNGDPLTIPMFYQYPDEEAGYDLNDQFLLGSDILIASVYEANATGVDVYFPGGKEQYWYQIAANVSAVYVGSQTSKVPVNINFIPIFYRGGSIIAKKEIPRKSATEMINDPFTIHVIPDQNKKAEGNIFIDDYESFEYINNKNYLYLKLSYDGNLFLIALLSPGYRTLITMLRFN